MGSGCEIVSYITWNTEQQLSYLTTCLIYSLNATTCNMTFAGRPLHSVQYKHAIHLAKWHMNRSSVWDWTCTTTTQNILGKRMIRSLLRTSPGKIYEYTPQYIQVLRIVQRPLSRFAKYPIRSNPTSLLISNLHPIANAGIASLVIPTLQSYSTEYYVSMLNTQQ